MNPNEIMICKHGQPTDGQPYCTCGDKLKVWCCLNNICALEWDGYEEPSECPVCHGELKEI